MFRSTTSLKAMVLALLLATLPLPEALGADRSEAAIGAAPRRAPVTPGPEVTVETVIESIEVETYEVLPGDDPAVLPPFPGRANLVPSLSAVSRFCNRPGSLPFLTRDGCKAALSRFSQYFGRNLYYESMGECLDFLHSQRVNRHPIVSEHNAWCDQTFDNLHDRRGCYDAVPVFLGSLTEQGFCRNLPPLPAGPVDTEAPYIYGYKEPGQKIDSPKRGRMPGNNAAKPAAKAAPAKAASQKSSQSSASAPSAKDSAVAPEAQAGMSTTGGAGTQSTGGLPGQGRAPAAGNSQSAGSPVARGVILPPTSSTASRGQAQAATLGPGSSQPGIAAPSPAGGHTPASAGSSSPPNTAPLPSATPAPEAAAPIEPVTSDVPSWPAARDFSDDAAVQEALEAAAQSPVVSPGAVPPGVIATDGGQVAATGQLPPQGPQPSILPVLPGNGAVPRAPLAEPVIGTREQVQPLPPVPEIGRIAPQLMPGVPADSAVMDATLPAPDPAPVVQTQEAPPLVDAFGEVIPNFIPPALPDPLANPALSLPQSGAPAGQAD